MKLVCGDDEDKWEESVAAGNRALKARMLFYQSILEQYELDRFAGPHAVDEFKDPSPSCQQCDSAYNLAIRIIRIFKDQLHLRSVVSVCIDCDSHQPI